MEEDTADERSSTDDPARETADETTLPEPATDAGSSGVDDRWDPGTTTTGVPDAVDDASDVREVPKQSFCHQCEYFTPPPEVACTNDGTAILELASIETFLVEDCPVVEEERRLAERS